MSRFDPSPLSCVIFVLCRTLKCCASRQEENSHALKSSIATLPSPIIGGVLLKMFFKKLAWLGEHPLKYTNIYHSLSQVGHILNTL